MSTNTIQPGFTLPAAAGKATAAAPAVSATFGELLSAFAGSQDQSGQGLPAANLACLVAEPAQGEPATALTAQLPAPPLTAQEPLSVRALKDQPALLPAAAAVGAANVPAPDPALLEQVATKAKDRDHPVTGQEALPVIDTAAPAALPAVQSSEPQQVPAFHTFLAAAPAVFTPPAPAGSTRPAAAAGPAPAGVTPQAPVPLAFAPSGITAAAAAAAPGTAGAATPAQALFSAGDGGLQPAAPVAAASNITVESSAPPLLVPAPAGALRQAPITPAGPAAPAGAPLAPAPLQQVPQLQAAQVQAEALHPTDGGALPASATTNPVSPSAPEAFPDRTDANSSPTPLAGISEAPRLAAPAAPAGPAPAPLPQQPMAAQLARPLFTLATETPGEHVMTMKVSPEDLGPVTVRAHISSDGVRLELFAAGDAGRDAVRTALPELRRELAQQGLTATLDLSGRDTPGQGQPMGQQHRGNHEQRGPYQSSLRMVTEAEPAPGQTVRPLSSTAGLDVVA